MDARERFKATRAAVTRLHDVQLLLMYNGDDWRPEGVRAAHETSDPTAQQAIRNVDELAEKLEALRREEQELTDLIGESLAIIEGVRTGFGEVYANLLEWRSIDLLTWSDIHEQHGIPRSSGHYLLGIAYDWIDSVGVSRLLRGEVDV